MCENRFSLIAQHTNKRTTCSFGRCPRNYIHRKSIAECEWLEHTWDCNQRLHAYTLPKSDRNLRASANFINGKAKYLHFDYSLNRFKMRKMCTVGVLNLPGQFRMPMYNHNTIQLVIFPLGLSTDENFERKNSYFALWFCIFNSREIQIQFSFPWNSPAPSTFHIAERSGADAVKGAIGLHKTDFYEPENVFKWFRFEQRKKLSWFLDEPEMLMRIKHDASALRVERWEDMRVRNEARCRCRRI